MMKRTHVVLMAVLAVASMAVAQNNKQNQPAQQKQAGQQQQQQQPAGQAGGTKQAKSKEEYAAYNTANGLTDPAALEAAANDFVQKFPDSDLKGYLYVRDMALYQQAGNSDKVIEVGRKALSFIPDDPATLAMVASELVERTRETDLDRDERLGEASKYANHALESIDKVQAPPGMTPEQVAEGKNQLKAASYSALGMAAYLKKDYVGAEKQFRSAMDAFPNDPEKDYVMLRLTVALDKQGKYAEALDWANKTLAAAKPGSPVQQLAQQEKARLTPLAAGAQKPAAAPPTSPSPTTAPTSPQPQSVNPK